MYVSMIWIRYSIQELSSICAYVSAWSPQHLTCVTNAASGSGDSIPPVSQPNRVSTVIIADNRTPPTTEADSLSPVVPVQHNPISPSSTIPNLSLPETGLDHPFSLTQLDPTQDGALIDFSRSTSTGNCF